MSLMIIQATAVEREAIAAEPCKYSKSRTQYQYKCLSLFLTQPADNVPDFSLQVTANVEVTVRVVNSVNALGTVAVAFVLAMAVKKVTVIVAPVVYAPKEAQNAVKSYQDCAYMVSVFAICMCFMCLLAIKC